MNLTGIEIVDMEDGGIRAVECVCSRRNVQVKNSAYTSFGKPLLSVTNGELRGFFKERSLNRSNVLIILPDSLYLSKLWAEDIDGKTGEKEALTRLMSYAADNRTEMRISKNSSVQVSFSGIADAVGYGIITAVEKEILGRVYEIFEGFGLKYVLPSITAYSLLKYAGNDNCSGVMDLKENRLTFAIYNKGILAWLSDFSYISGSSSHNKGCIDLSRIYNTALIALNTARGSRLYPSKIYLTGAMANAKNIGAELTALLETNCEQRIYEQGTDQPAGAELSTLIGVMRGIYRAD